MQVLPSNPGCTFSSQSLITYVGSTFNISLPFYPASTSSCRFCSLTLNAFLPWLCIFIQILLLVSILPSYQDSAYLSRFYLLIQILTAQLRLTFNIVGTLTMFYFVIKVLHLCTCSNTCTVSVCG